MPPLRALAPGATILAAVILAVLLSSLPVWSLMHPRPDAGWDFRVVCGAAAALGRGDNPYLVGNLGQDTQLSFPYLPQVAWLARPLCVAEPNGVFLVPLLFLGLLSGSCAAMARSLGCRWRHVALVAAAAPGVFAAGNALVITGNPTILEVPLMAFAIVAWHRRRLYASAAAIGALASLKILPVVWLASFVLMPGGRRRRASALACGLACFGLIVGINLLVLGRWSAAFLAQLAGKIPNQHSAIGEQAIAASDPNLIDAAFAFGRAMGLDHPAASATLIAMLFLGIGTALGALRRRTGTGEAWASTRLFCLTGLALALCLFRLKPYAFVTLVPLALGACIGPAGLMTGRFVLVLLALPAALILMSLPAIGPVAADYYQAISALLALMALIVAEIRLQDIPDIQRPVLPSRSTSSAS